MCPSVWQGSPKRLLVGQMLSQAFVADNVWFYLACSHALNPLKLDTTKVEFVLRT